MLACLLGGGGGEDVANKKRDFGKLHAEDGRGDGKRVRRQDGWIGLAAEQESQPDRGTVRRRGFRHPVVFAGNPPGQKTRRRPTPTPNTDTAPFGGGKKLCGLRFEFRIECEQERASEKIQRNEAEF